MIRKSSAVPLHGNQSPLRIPITPSNGKWIAKIRLKRGRGTAGSLMGKDLEILRRAPTNPAKHQQILVWKSSAVPLHQSPAFRQPRGLAPAVNFELGQDVADMALDGVQADEQGVGDLFIRGAGRHQAKHFLFALGKGK